MHRFCFYLTSLDVYHQLLKLKKVTPGPDDIPGNLLKRYAVYLVDPLSYIFNLSIGSLKFPAIWKYANIRPIPKNNGEFRPISLLSCISKVFESLILNKWILPALKKDFESNQFAFTNSGFCGTSN